MYGLSKRMCCLLMVITGAIVFIQTSTGLYRSEIDEHDMKWDTLRTESTVNFMINYLFSMVFYFSLYVPVTREMNHAPVSWCFQNMIVLKLINYPLVMADFDVVGLIFELFWTMSLKIEYIL